MAELEAEVQLLDDRRAERERRARQAARERRKAEVRGHVERIETLWREFEADERALVEAMLGLEELHRRQSSRLVEQCDLARKLEKLDRADVAREALRGATRSNHRRVAEAGLATYCRAVLGRALPSQGARFADAVELRRAAGRLFAFEGELQTKAAARAHKRRNAAATKGKGGER